MVVSISSHAIAPAVVLRGEGAWAEALSKISALCSRPLLLGRSQATVSLRSALASDLVHSCLTPQPAELRNDCCEEDLQRVSSEAADGDAVLAAGGGKVLDAGKLLAHRLQLPCITVPLSAATCAGLDSALKSLFDARCLRG